MDIITLVGVGLLVTERIMIHIIRGIRHSKSKCCKDCCSCEISNPERSEGIKKDDHSEEETAGTAGVEVSKNV
jgi:hypothetical protein